MLDLRITLKNVRSFSDEAPAIFDLRRGITAVVGPNNAGKSSLLRLFFELRPLLSSLRDMGVMKGALKGGFIPASNISGDPTRLLFEGNDRPAIVRLDLPHSGDETVVTAVEFELDRGDPRQAKVHFFKGPKRQAFAHGAFASHGPTSFSVNGGIIDAQCLQEQANLLSNTLYIGPFRNVLNQSSASYYDIQVGTAFVVHWDSWKTGDIQAQNRAIKEVEGAIARLFGFPSIEINATPNKTEFRVFVDGNPYLHHEQGSGLTQFILTLGTAATRDSSLIIIDEPELNLHPSMQVDFVTTLATFATQGVLFSTHSIGLARSVAPTIYAVRKKGKRSELSTFEDVPSITELAGELSFSTFRDIGFDRLLLVEGPTDVPTFQQLLRKLGKDSKVVIFPLMGHAFASGDHSAAIAELLRLASPAKIAALVDSERTSEGGKPDSKRAAFAEACSKAGITNVLLTARRATENYFSDAAVKRSLGDAYQALGPFEEFKSANKKWSKAMNWKIANCTQLEELEGTDLLDFLRRV